MDSHTVTLVWILGGNACVYGSLPIIIGETKEVKAVEAYTIDVGRNML